MTGKVIDFTEAWVKRQERTESNEDLGLDDDLLFAYKFSYDVAVDVVVALHDMGYNVGSDTKGILDIILLEEAIRSLMLRSCGKEYEFHPFIDGMFIDENGDELDYDLLMMSFIESLKNEI